MKDELVVLNQAIEIIDRVTVKLVAEGTFGGKGAIVMSVPGQFLRHRPGLESRDMVEILVTGRR